MCVSYCLQSIGVGLSASKEPNATNDTEINTPIAQDPNAHDSNGGTQWNPAEEHTLNSCCACGPE